MIKILLFLLKKGLIIFIIFLVLGRFFFPKIVENGVISPAKELPLVGQVLGTTWERAGTIPPVITQKTVEFSDKVEHVNLPLNETIENITKSEKPGETISDIIEKSIDEKVNSVKDLPEHAVEKLKSELRKEMYSQVCQNWEELESTSSAETN
ncbi:MAG: hypothetical protein ACOX6V_03450 [Patescibacteria group bacterium]|jgi:hypothetical protein